MIYQLIALLSRFNYDWAKKGSFLAIDYSLARPILLLEPSLYLLREVKISSDIWDQNLSTVLVFGTIALISFLFSLQSTVLTITSHKYLPVDRNGITEIVEAYTRSSTFAHIALSYRIVGELFRSCYVPF